MKIFQVVFAANDYQSLFPEDESLWSRNLLTFDGTSKSTGWTPPRLYCLKPKLRRGDFFGGIPGALIASPETLKKVKNYFMRAGELLPVIVEDQPEPFTLLNITACI